MPVPPEELLGKVQNGYILRVINGNCSEFKEMYLKPVMVFDSLQDLYDWLVMRF